MLKSTNFKLLSYLELHNVSVDYYVNPCNSRVVIGEYLDTPSNRELTDRYDSDVAEVPPKTLLRKYEQLIQKSKAMVLSGGAV
jgi:hypothetical protein